MLKKFLFFLLFFLKALPLEAATQKLIICGKLFDSQNGVWLANQKLLIRGNVIQELNPKTWPKETVILDFRDKHVIPGLIDSHTHLFLEDPTFANDFSKGLLKFVQGKTLIERKRLGETRAVSLLKSGFTSVRDLGNQSEITKIVSNNAPRFFTSGSGYTPKMGQFPRGTTNRIIQKEYILMSSASSQLSNFKFDLVKLYADEDPNSTITPREILKSWTAEARKQAKTVAIHANLKEAIDNAIEAAPDSIEHGHHVTVEQLKLMAKRKIIFVPTNADVTLLDERLKSIKPPYIENWVSEICSKIALAKKENVLIAYGSDNYFSLEKFGINFGEATLKSLLHYGSCGLTPTEALRSATYLAATTMGKESMIGTLNKGAFADFLVFKNDPSRDLEELRAVYKVFKGGEEVN